MDIKTLAIGLGVTAQITAADLKSVQAAGYRAIICNRPDGEDAGQPRFAEIAKAAEKLGIRSVYQPIVAGQLSDEDAMVFAQHLTELPGPVLAYCRSGARSATLWSRAQAIGAV